VCAERYALSPYITQKLLVNKGVIIAPQPVHFRRRKLHFTSFIGDRHKQHSKFMHKTSACRGPQANSMSHQCCGQSQVVVTFVTFSTVQQDSYMRFMMQVSGQLHESSRILSMRGVRGGVVFGVGLDTSSVAGTWNKRPHHQRFSE
jgi:hypothetical protein